MYNETTTTDDVIGDIAQLRRQVESLKSVDEKIDRISKLLSDVKDGIEFSHQSIIKHELILEEIRVNADFRKRESENSVREIKTQMVGMGHDLDINAAAGVDKIIERLDHFEKSQQNDSMKLTQYFTTELDSLKARVTSIEKWNTFNIAIVLLVAIIFTFFP